MTTLAPGLTLGDVGEEQLELMRRCGVNVAYFEEPSISVYRRPRGSQLHHRQCRLLARGGYVRDQVSVVALLRAHLHRDCFADRWSTPIPYPSGDVLGAALDVAETLERVHELEVSDEPLLARRGVLLSARRRLEQEVFGLVRTTSPGGVPVLSEATAQEVVRRLDRVLEAGLRVDPLRKLLAVAARRVGVRPPPGTLECAGVARATGAAVPLTRWWQAYCDALAAGHGYAHAKACVIRQPPGGDELDEAGLGPSERDAVLTYWRGVLETVASEGCAPIVVHAVGPLFGQYADLVRGGYRPTPLHPAANPWAGPVLLVLPELLAEELLLGADQSVRWLGPGGADAAALVEVHASLFADKVARDGYELAFAVVNNAGRPPAPSLPQEALARAH